MSSSTWFTEEIAKELGGYVVVDCKENNKCPKGFKYKDMKENIIDDYVCNLDNYILDKSVDPTCIICEHCRYFGGYISPEKNPYPMKCLNRRKRSRN